MIICKTFHTDVYKIKTDDKLFNREREIISEYLRNSVLGDLYIHVKGNMVDNFVPITYLIEESERFIKRINEKILSR